MGEQSMRLIDDNTPRGVWIVAGMAVPKSKDNPSGWWEATVILQQKEWWEDPHWTDGDSIMHYNGSTLVGGFRGPLTHWRPLVSPVKPKRAAYRLPREAQGGDRG
ncbi:hypothetical protein ACW7BJ_16110 [Azospirillum argentinense]